MKIFKYELNSINSNTPFIEMPKDAKILNFAIQDGAPVIWALVNPNSEMSFRDFVIYGTGWEIVEPVDNLKYINTIQSGGLVWHLFEKLIRE